jgi:hypothetical protein
MHSIQFVPVFCVGRLECKFDSVHTNNEHNHTMPACERGGGGGGGEGWEGGVTLRVLGQGERKDMQDTYLEIIVT